MNVLWVTNCFLIGLKKLYRREYIYACTIELVKSLREVTCSIGESNTGVFPNVLKLFSYMFIPTDSCCSQTGLEKPLAAAGSS